MLDKKQATDAIRKAFPTAIIKSVIEYQDKYVFHLLDTGLTDGDYDSFFSVNQNTGNVADFSILTDGDTNQIIDLFVQAET